MPSPGPHHQNKNREITGRPCKKGRAGIRHRGSGVKAFKNGRNFLPRVVYGWKTISDPRGQQGATTNVSGSVEKIDFEYVHYTPKHGSWLDIAEIGINIMTRECLDRRIPNIDKLCQELKAWNDSYDKNPSPVNWQFTAQYLRIKLKKLYPDIGKLREERKERQKAKAGKWPPTSRRRFRIRLISYTLFKVQKEWYCNPA